MKIVDERGPKKILFGILKVGDCFIDEDHDTMMKIYRSHVDHPNAVNLLTGFTYEMDDGDEVTPITTVLRIVE